MLTLTRSGLTLNLNASVVPATGSSNVPILYMEEIADDYTGYLVEPRIGFTQNGKYTEFIGTYEEESQSVIIPAQCFANTGSVDITIALIDPEDPDHVEVCTPKKFSVTKAPMGTVVLPEEPTWQDYVLNYMKQNLDKLQGPKGDKGDPGDNATINVGAVTTLEPGQEATVANTGSETNAVLAFGIPKGEKGDKGDAGDNATIAIGTVTTLEPDQEATVQNTGTDTNAVLAFGIPKGETGATGPQGPQGEPGVNENVLHADISKSENPSVDDAYGTPLQDLKLYGKSTQVSTSGAQLWQNPAETTSKGVTLTHLEDGWINLNGTCTESANISLLNNHVDSGTYTISFEKQGSLPDNANAIAQVYSATGGALSIANNANRNYSAQLNEADDYQFRIRIDVGFNYENVKVRVMFQKGNEATAYEPYTGEKPSPSPDYPQEITKIEEVDCNVVGKNLFNINNEDQYYSNVVISHTDTEIKIKYKPTPWAQINNLIVGETYTVSYHSVNEKAVSNSQLRYALSTQYGVYPTGKFDSAVGNGNTTYDNVITFEAPAETIYLTGSIQNETITQFQIEKGSTATAYEPYQSQHVQFTPPAPLYSLLDGSVADYVDVARGKYVYQLADVTFDGSEDEAWGEYSNENSGYEGFLIQRLDMKVANRQSGFCDKLNISVDPGGSANLYSVWLGVFNNYIYIPYANTFAGTTNATEFRTWLATNNLQFIYPLATPTEQDIPAETLEALQALKTFNGVTNIFCNAPVSAQYEQSVQIVMNKILEQLNKLQTQTLNLQEEMINNV